LKVHTILKIVVKKAKTKIIFAGTPPNSLIKVLPYGNVYKNSIHTFGGVSVLFLLRLMNKANSLSKSQVVDYTEAIITVTDNANVDDMATRIQKHPAPIKAMRGVKYSVSLRG
jgi:hypothetical protein